jgi:hypothetical protein
MRRRTKDVWNRSNSYFDWGGGMGRRPAALWGIVGTIGSRAPLDLPLGTRALAGPETPYGWQIPPRSSIRLNPPMAIGS